MGFSISSSEKHPNLFQAPEAWESSPLLTFGSLVQRFGQAVLFLMLKHAQRQSPCLLQQVTSLLKVQSFRMLFFPTKWEHLVWFFLPQGPQVFISHLLALVIYVLSSTHPPNQKLTTESPKWVMDLGGDKCQSLIIVLQVSEDNSYPQRSIFSFQVCFYVFLYVPRVFICLPLSHSSPRSLSCTSSVKLRVQNERPNVMCGLPGTLGQGCHLPILTH